MAILEFTRRYAMAHRLLADKTDRCATPHGHNEFVTVKLAPLMALALGGDNRLAHFSDVKRQWHAWIDAAVDHAFQVNAADPLIGFFQEHEPERLERLMVFPGDPTTEALCAAFYLKCSAFIAAQGLPFTVAEVRVEETPTNAVSMTADMAKAASHAFAKDHWARRPDASINDFGASAG